MNRPIATLVFVAIIAGLFFLDRDKHVRTSKALWIPLIWCLIVGSRPVSMWLNVERTQSLAERFTESSPIDATVFGLLIGAGALTLNLRAPQVKKFLLANLPILLFFSYCALSVLWADHPAIAFKRWIKAAGDFIMILVVLTDANPLVATRRLFTRAGFVLLPLSVLFIKYFPNLGSSYDQTDRSMMYFGVSTFKNELGLTCLVCGLASLWSFLATYPDRSIEHRTNRLAAHGAIFLTAFWLIIKADSMTSFSCLVIGAGVMILTATRWISLRPGSVFGLVAGATSLALFAVFIDTAGTLVGSLGRNSTLTGRTLIWAAVLAQHVNPLLGAGFESFWMGSRMQSVWDMSQFGIEEAHNGYLEVYLNLGWIGLIAFGVLIVSGYRHAYSAFRADPHAGRLRIVFFTTSLIYSLTEAGFREMSPIWIAFLLAVTNVPRSLREWHSEATQLTPMRKGTLSHARILQ